MRKRRQIARCANRPLRRDAGIDARVDQSYERVNRLRPHAGMPPSQTDGFQCHDEAHGAVGEARAGTDAMRQHKIRLQLGEFVRCDHGLSHLAEPGVDSIDHLASCDHIVDHRMAAFDRCKRTSVDLDWRGVAQYAAQLVEPDLTGHEVNNIVDPFHDCPIQAG